MPIFFLLDALGEEPTLKSEVVPLEELLGRLNGRNLDKPAPVREAQGLKAHKLTEPPIASTRIPMVKQLRLGLSIQASYVMGIQKLSNRRSTLTPI
jgi:hypothetical protein